MSRFITYTLVAGLALGLGAFAASRNLTKPAGGCDCCPACVEGGCGNCPGCVAGTCPNCVDCDACCGRK